MATAGEEEGSLSDAGGDLQLVHRRVRHEGLARGQGATARTGFTLTATACVSTTEERPEEEVDRAIREPLSPVAAARQKERAVDGLNARMKQYVTTADPLPPPT
jgi:hypothetical protein